MLRWQLVFVSLLTPVSLTACGRPRDLRLTLDRWPDGEIVPSSFALHPEATFSAARSATDVVSAAQRHRKLVSGS